MRMVGATKQTPAKPKAQEKVSAPNATSKERLESLCRVEKCIADKDFYSLFDLAPNFTDCQLALDAELKLRLKFHPDNFP